MKTFMILLVVCIGVASANPWEEREKRGLETCFKGSCDDPTTHCCLRFVCRRLRGLDEECDTWRTCGCQQGLTCQDSKCQPEPGSGGF